MIKLGNAPDLIGEDLVELSFSVPDLQQRPVIGGGCCAVPAEFLVVEVSRHI